MKYDVSILVPIYNVEKYIERCLRSLLEQTYNSIQFVFIDDCTPDNSVNILRQILQEYPERESAIKIIKHERNRGLAAARNTGVHNADGEYILHIDSDDYVEADMVQCMFLKAKEENADIVVADYFLEWEKVSKYVHVEISADIEGYVRQLLDSSALPVVWNKMIRKEIYIKRNITAIEGINFGEDMMVTPKLVYYSEKVVKLDRAFLHYIQYNNNSYSRIIRDKNIEDIVNTLNHLKCFFAGVPKSDFFLEALESGRQQKKLEFLKHIDNKRLNKILEIFSDTKVEVDANRFGIFDNLVLTLSRTNIPMLRILIFGYKKVFSAAQFFKRR